MKTNYRKLFIQTLTEIKESRIQELKIFALSKPIPCWGGIYKKVCELNLNIKQKNLLLEAWVNNPECSRFTGLLIYMNRRDEVFLKLIINNHYQQLPEYLQIYIAAFPIGQTILRQQNKLASSGIIQIINNHELLSKEIQLITAKFKKLLRFDLAPEPDKSKAKN